MRIDGHHHLWDLDLVEYPWLEADEVRFFGDPTPIRRDYLWEEFSQTAQGFGFEASVHIQVGAADPLAEAAFVESQRLESGGRWPAAQVAFADLTDPGLETALDDLAQFPSVRGIRQIVGRSAEEDAKTGTNTLLGDPAFARGLGVLAERGLSFDLQLTPGLMEATAEVLRQVPSLLVALCHAGSPHDRSAAGLADWARALRALSDLPNVACKLSGLGMFDHGWTTDSIRPIVETALEQFTHERLIFGSNFPVDSLNADYGGIIGAYEVLLGDLPGAAQDMVFGGNAAAFYGIGVGADGGVG